MHKFKLFLEMIKFEHTIFALPFAYLGAFLAARFQTGRGWPSLTQLFWITLAMVGARTAAMALNRLIDRGIDAGNPRTAARALPQGLLGVGEVLAYIVLSFALLTFAAYELNPLTLKLMPVAVIFLTLYSYTKRFTWACHLVLGVTDALAPMGGWIAVTGSFDYQGVLLALAVAIWIAGFDIVYSCQDLDFDKAHRIHSIPNRFGLYNALIISAAFHVVTAILLAWVGVILHLGFIYYVGVLIAAVLLYKQHRMVSPTDLSRLGFAFFNMNSYISLVVFFAALADLAWPIRIF